MVKALGLAAVVLLSGCDPQTEASRAAQQRCARQDQHATMQCLMIAIEAERAKAADAAARKAATRNSGSNVAGLN